MSNLKHLTVDEQYQAFGYVKSRSSELGYICLVEILGSNVPVEIDLYFEPKTLGEIKAQG